MHSDTPVNVLSANRSNKLLLPTPATHKNLLRAHCIWYLSISARTHWATSLYETFAEPKLRSKYLLKSQKLKWFRWDFRWAWTCLLRPNFGLSKSLSKSLSPKKYRFRPKLSQTNLAKVGSICMEEIALALRAWLSLSLNLLQLLTNWVKTWRLFTVLYLRTVK